MVGMDGFEPSHNRVKVYRLVAWLHPKNPFQERFKNLNLNNLKSIQDY